jgi:hypothetical protein
MAYFLNPLPDYIEDEKLVLYELDFESERTHTISHFRKIKFRIGTIVILFNALEKLIESCIMEIMNGRGEDARVWILIKDFTFFKKEESLNDLYCENIRALKENDAVLLEKVKLLFTDIKKVRGERNIYVHCNWINSHNLEHFETKVKTIKEESGYFRVRKRITIKNLDDCIKDIENVMIKLEVVHEEVFYVL